MLSFATEFPVDAAKGLAGFVDAVKIWILNSPHTPFIKEDIERIPTNGEWRTQKGTHDLRVLTNISDNNVHALFRLNIFSENVEWITDIIYYKHESDAWIGVRVSRESQYPVAELPEARKPVVVGIILSEIGGAHDGPLQTTRTPHLLGNDDIALASQIIRGASGCHLPTIYVSSKFSGGYFVDCNALAHDLAGMAHVVVEPNRAFSTRLKIEVNSKNAYGGVVGLYWPDGSGSRVFFDDYCANERQFKSAIVDEIRSALLHRRPLYECTRASVVESVSRAALEDLKRSKSSDLDSYIKHFDEELLATKSKFADAEIEIHRLKSELKRLESASGSEAGLFLSTGNEQEFYDGEIRNFVVEAIATAAENAQDDSRRQHVLRAIVDSNVASSISRSRREELKTILREFRSMDKKSRDGLTNLGFSISDGGKHFKIVYSGDERYTFTLPKSGSDYKGGLNAASDIAKRLF